MGMPKKTPEAKGCTLARAAWLCLLPFHQPLQLYGASNGCFIRHD
jgi:hypothetical protein